MPDLDLTAIASARRRVSQAEDALREIRLALGAAQTKVTMAASLGDRETLAATLAEAQAIDARREKVLTVLRKASNDVRDVSNDILQNIRPENAVSTLSGRHPILMLPVRVETRFFDGGTTLKVRIFPDQIHITAHDPSLTETEIEGLAWYWLHRWPAPDSATDEGRLLAEEAWQGLNQRLSEGRAAYVVRNFLPTNLGGTDPAPAWDDLPRRAPGVMPRAQAALLPDRWCVIGYRGSPLREVFREWGQPVPDRLAAGPSPDLGPASTPGGLPDDPDLLWLRDAREAERLGMLVTVRRPDLTQGLDRLVVLGVDWTIGPDEAAASVEAHLRAQGHEGRLRFVPQGTPTNSTGTERSGYSTDPVQSHKAIAPHLPLASASDAAGPVAARFLGLSDGSLSHLPGADLLEQGWQGALIDATWSAIGGYYLTEMLDPIADDPAISTSLRRHAVAHLRSAGPVPVLRSGAQPYGMLPIMPKERFEPNLGSRAQADIARVSAALRQMVEPWIATVPRLAQVRSRGDVDDILLALLQRTPVAWSLNFRNLVGPIERKAVSVYWDRIAAFQTNLTAILMSKLGCDRLVQLAELTHDARDHALRVPLVEKPDPTPEDPKHTSTAYFEEVRSLLTVPGGTDILDARQNSTALLEAFIASAASHENRLAAKALLDAAEPGLNLSPAFKDYLKHPATRIPYSLRIEPISASPAAANSSMAAPMTPREFGKTIIPPLTGSLTLTEHVASRFHDRMRIPGSFESPDDPLHWLARFDAALATLATAPPKDLEWSFRGLLDLYATRLDAWITSLATARLSEHREVAPKGLHVGGWGIVEDLAPDRGASAESLGFVHAPSLGQAVSAAVMRSARLSHRDAEGRLFDIDLTSRRVREALRLLDGVAQGQRLAALLGYRVERALQERDLLLAQWILPLRQQCPLRSESPNGPLPEPTDSVAARDVVDGLALLARWEAERDALLAAAGIPAGAPRDGVSAVLDDVAGLADAVSDVLMAEAVHQATLGNLERSGAALAAHDRQERAPDPEVVRTPRGGPVLTHRAGLWLAREATDPAPGWPADLRSLAEPRLDRWLGLILGDPARWTISASLLRDHDQSGERVDLPPLTLADIGLSALSLILAARRPGAGQASELESRLVARFAPSAGERIEIAPDGLASLIDLAAWANEVIAGAPLAPEHLAAADNLALAQAQAAAPDVAEAVARSEAVSAHLGQLIEEGQAALAALIAAPNTVTIGALSNSLLALVETEGPEALAPGEDTPLAVHAASILKRAQARLDAARSLTLPDPAPTSQPGAGEPPELIRARGVVRLLLGNGQPFLPVLLPAAPERLAAPLAARDTLLASDKHAPATWLHRCALVRPLLDPLAALLVHAEADGAPVARDLAIMQLPHQPDGRWIALPFGPAGAPPEGTMAIVLHAPDGVEPASGGAGIVIDSWTETVPAMTETTAVTFHYDAPGARAPQTMLLAVHPAKMPDRWDFDTLAASINEAMDLGKLRTLGSKEWAPLATFIPAIFLPDSYSRDVPSVSLWELVANLKGGLIGDHVFGKAED
jgi:hypothetical protein